MSKALGLRKSALLAATLAATTLATPATAQVSAPTSSSDPKAGSATPSKLDLPFTKYTLDNGLTVILHEDHALPLVAVNIEYKVGSRFEEPKRTGFAHLFEHLMFMGTARVPTKAFDGFMEAEGGSNNASTGEDRTDYYDVAPSHALPLLLWLEADRLSALGDEMTLAKLDAQREVVRNERRQTSENTPYGKAELILPDMLFPEGHPYHHPVIGSHEDLQAAQVADVKQFFARWYVPSNASLVIAGDFDPAKAKEQVQSMFGGIPKGAVPSAPMAPTLAPLGLQRKTIEDNVNLPKVILAWRSAARFQPGDAELDLAAEVLRHGKSSRLYKALVYDKQLAQEVEAYQSSQDLGSFFAIEAIARPGVPLDKLEKAIDAEVAKLSEQAVPDAELSRAKNQYESAFVTRIQSVLERASLLNRYETFVGDPGFAEKDLGRYRAVTAESLRARVKSTLEPQNRVILRILPHEDPAAKKAPAKKGKKP